MTEKSFLKWIAGSCTAAALLIVLGCSNNDGLGARYKVTGKVTYKDAPLAKGSISFVPEDPKGGNRGAVGDIVDGYYSLTTQTPGDGAFPGKYRVEIASKEAVSDAAIEEEMKKAFAKKGISPGSMPSMPKGGGNMGAEFAFKARKTAKSLIPEKFAAARTSNLTAEVKEQSNTIDFPLGD